MLLLLGQSKKAIFELFHPLENNIDTINQRLIEEYISYLLKKRLAGKTVATYVCSLRTIVYFFIQKGYVSRKGEKDSYLFCNDTGSQMSDGCLGCAIKSFNLSRGVNRTSIHAFRHTHLQRNIC